MSFLDCLQIQEQFCSDVFPGFYRAGAGDGAVRGWVSELYKTLHSPITHE